MRALYGCSVTERVPHCAQSAWLWPVVRPQWSWQRRRSQPTSQHRYSHFWWSSLYRKNQTTNKPTKFQPTNQSSNQPSSNQPRYSHFCRKFWCLSLYRSNYKPTCKTTNLVQSVLFLAAFWIRCQHTTFQFWTHLVLFISSAKEMIRTKFVLPHEGWQ